MFLASHELSVYKAFLVQVMSLLVWGYWMEGFVAPWIMPSLLYYFAFNFWYIPEFNSSIGHILTPQFIADQTLLQPGWTLELFRQLCRSQDLQKLVIRMRFGLGVVTLTATTISAIWYLNVSIFLSLCYKMDGERRTFSRVAINYWFCVSFLCIFLQYLELNRHRDALSAWKNATLQEPTHVAAWANTIILLDNLGLWRLCWCVLILPMQGWLNTKHSENNQSEARITSVDIFWNSLLNDK